MVAGMQGIGVNAPIAAAVAEATVGLARLVHMPNEPMFTSGLWSMMLAAGWLPHSSRHCASTVRTAGASPKLH